MKTFLILGAGTGGTMVANKMAHELIRRNGKSLLLINLKVIIINLAFYLFPLGSTIKLTLPNVNAILFHPRLSLSFRI